jgi:hypothetical protein
LGTTAPEERGEDVAEIRKTFTTEALLRAAVILLTLRWVAEDVVGVRNELEALLGVRARVHIGVKLPRKLAIGLLYFVNTSIALNTEYVVMISHERQTPC